MKQFCPSCAAVGKQAELFENNLLKRCLRCDRDYKIAVKDSTPTAKPIKGLKNILGI